MGGGETKTVQPYSVDEAGLSDFIRSGTGSQFANTYKPGSSYVDTGEQLLGYAPGTSGGGQDSTAMLREFEKWSAANAQTKANWSNYSNAVNANEGGQGDNTITVGDAVGQRQQLLGALANAGNPTEPTPGLGSMVKLMQNGKAAK